MTGDRLIVGVVTPHEAAGPEVELPALSRGRVAVLLARAGPPPTTSQQWVGMAALETAVKNFRGTTIDAVAHASTTTGYVIGRRAEAALVDHLSYLCGVPAVASCAAAVAALRTYEVERIQLVHPPWFDDELDDLGAVYFRSQGLEVMVTKATGLPDDPAGVHPHHVVDWVQQHVNDRAEAVFLAGNGFRSAGAVDELAHRTGRPVLAANQALLLGVLSATDDAGGR